MSVSANDLITRAMKSLQALGQTEVPSAGEANDGLVALNAMLDSWSNENLASYAVLEQSFVLSPGTNSYTIGSGGVINVTRPLDIVQAYLTDASNNNFILQILPRDKWNQIGDRSTNITSQLPDTMFYDPQFPLGVINIFPTPLLAYTVFFDSVTQQTQFSTLTQTLSMPPGYERAMVYNLAVEISNMFGIPIPPVAPGAKNVGQLAMDSLGNIKRTNIKDVIADYDASIVSRSYYTYNIYRDS
jgi:hypothetical protein